jgi:predicted AAA+ superfamily ATPase
VAFVDSGIAAHLFGVGADRLRDVEGPLGPLLEGFVLMELARQLTWSDEFIELFHYRTKDTVEVDAMLENWRGQVVAIEVKASATVRGADSGV